MTYPNNKKADFSNDDLPLTYIVHIILNPIRTGVFSERLSLGRVFFTHTPWFIALVVKSKASNFDTQLKMGKV